MQKSKQLYELYAYIFLKYVHIMELYMQKTAHILSFGLFRLPWGCGADGDGGRTDPVFFGDVLDVAIVNFHKVPTV